MIKKITSAVLAAVLAVSAWTVSFAKTETIIMESFSSVDHWKQTNADKVSLCTDSDYVKEGGSSLRLLYPVSAQKGEYDFTSTSWSTGGFEMPAAAPGMTATSIGIWVYGSGNDNLTLSFNISDAQRKIVETEKKVLDFEGWQYLTFDLSKDAAYAGKTHIYSILLKWIEKVPNETAEYIYLDALDVTFGPDPQLKEELKVFSSLENGAEDVGLNPLISLRFTNMLEEGEIEKITIEPAAPFTVEQTGDKTYMLSFTEDLTASMAYTLCFNGITDVYGQTLTERIGFTTAAFSIEVHTMQSNGGEIADITQAQAGTFALDFACMNNNPALAGKDVLVFCAVYDSEGHMAGIASRKIILTDAAVPAAMEMQLKRDAAVGMVFVIDEARGLVAKTQLKGA